MYKEIDDLRYKLVHEDRENDDLSIGEVNGVIDALTIIRRAGTVDAVPVKIGHWGKSNLWFDTFICSECEEPIDARETMFRYCPYCGAKMDKERRESE